MAENPSDGQGPCLDQALQTVQQEQGTSTTQKPEKNKPGMLCQTKVVYEVPKKKGNSMVWVEQSIQDSPQTPDPKLYALVCRLRKEAGDESTKPFYLHSLVVQSPILESVLRQVLATDISTTAQHVTFLQPFADMFHCREKLEQAQRQSDEAGHVALLLDTLTIHLGDAHRAVKDLTERGLTTFDSLWAIMPPKTVAYHRSFEQDYLVEVVDAVYLSGDRQACRIRCRSLDWDGDKYGWKHEYMDIEAFAGTAPISSLRLYPIDHHKTADLIKLQMAERGIKFIALKGCHHKTFHGKFRAWQKTFFGSDQIFIREQIMVDARGYAKHVKPIHLQPLSANDEAERAKGFPATKLMLFHPFVKAYALRTKCWGQLHVDGIFTIAWDQEALRTLLLEADIKKLVESFVLAHVEQTKARRLSDAAEAQGKPTILLLAGEPSIGKTELAEIVAEAACCPLYMMSATDLGTISQSVQEKLSGMFELASRWKAIILLEESDNFVEEGGSQEVVKVFLRMLGDYGGMLILTTSRPTVYQEAFASRIRMTLHYQTPDDEARRKHWEAMFEYADVDPNLSDADMRTISQRELDGRQINSIVKVAGMLASAKQASVDMKQVETAISVIHCENIEDKMRE